MIVFNMIYGFLKQYDLWILTSNNPSSTRKDFGNFDWHWSQQLWQHWKSDFCKETKSAA